MGIFKDTIFSIHPVKVEEETMEKFGDEVYVPQGHVDASARVLKSEDSYFLPSTYIVDHVTVARANTYKVLKIVSFEGLYADIAARNDRIIARGTLEDVLDKSGCPKYQRIVVGSQKGGELDFMKVVRPERGMKMT
jgi:predicted nucleotidyltransferase